MKNIKGKFLDDQEFFNLMQNYRITDPSNQDKVVQRFEDVKTFVRENIIENATELLEALKASQQAKTITEQAQAEYLRNEAIKKAES